MRKHLKAALLASTLVAGSAFADTYTLNSGANNWSLFNLTGVTVSSFNATLVANATGNSTLAGSFLASNGKTYGIQMTLSNTYTSGGNQYWANFSGAVSGNGLNLTLADGNRNRDAMDAVLGINAAPYNANTTLLEFGFWSSVGGKHNFDVNTTVTCTSATANANGTCGTSSGGTSGGTSNGGSVPVPGTAALAGLALAGMAARRVLKRV